MGAPMLHRVFDELLRHLCGCAEDVSLRVYVETAPGLPEAGMPPQRTFSDTPIVPRPIVLDEDGADAVSLKPSFAGRRSVDGSRKLVVSGNCEVRLGSILFFAGAEWEVTGLRAPVLYGETPLKLLLARRLQT